MAEKRKAVRRATDNGIEIERAAADATRALEAAARAAEAAANASAVAAQSLQATLAHERLCIEQHKGIMQVVGTISDGVKELKSDWRQAFAGAFVLCITMIGALIMIILRVYRLPA